MDSSDILSSQDNNQNNKELQIKNSLMKCYNQSLKQGKTVDIAKILDEYQNKFSVPKVLIMKWLGLNQRKSLFSQPKGQNNLSESYISQESEFTASESSPLGKTRDNSAILRGDLGNAKNTISNKEDNKFKRSSSLTLSKFSTVNRRTSCLNSLKFKLEVFEACHKKNSSNERSKFSPPRKICKKELNNIKECKEDEKLSIKSTLRQCISKKNIKPDFIIKKKSMPTIKITMPSKTPKREIKLSDYKTKQHKSERKLKNNRSIKNIEPSKKAEKRLPSRRSQKSALRSRGLLQMKKPSFPNLKKLDISKMAQSYFKHSLRTLSRTGQERKPQIKMQRKHRSQYRTPKPTSSKSNFLRGKFLSLNEFSKNNENSYLSYKNHIFTDVSKNLENKEKCSTISISDFLTSDTLGRNKKTLPDLSSNKYDSRAKICQQQNAFKNSGLSSQMYIKGLFGSDKSMFMCEGKKNSQMMTMANSLPKFGINLKTPQSYSTAALKTFSGTSKLKPKLLNCDLMEISEQLSLSSSREISLERLDKNNKDIPKQYILLRNSFNKRDESSPKESRKKRAFKIRKNKSRSKRSTSVC
ncbi:unnamed protein product [Moneuplotes crassus]|uniref:Uncharacterized protein n=1 Tax=Euplotes crassus TaxID=5936 RepID=A0AAD1XYD2_EUPCR|nr:unnamed protein product [Moneuplotes crassus]